jgi:cell division protein FtsL
VLVQLASARLAGRLRLRALGRFYAAGAVTLVLAVINLMLAAQATQSSYQVTALQATNRQLVADQQQLRYVEATQHTPARVEQEARKQGMSRPMAAGYAAPQPLPFDLQAPLSAGPDAGSAGDLLGAAIRTMLGATSAQPVPA